MFAQQAVINNNNNQRNSNLTRLFGSFSSTNQTTTDTSLTTLVNFFCADEELNIVASELDSFDGRRDPIRCTNLVSQMRAAQDKVISILFRLMDEWNCDRAPRDYRLKFPDDLFSGSENGESLNGQIWFGAECLAAGSNILNHETESDLLRPIAKVLTTKIDQLRMELKHCITDIDERGGIKFLCNDYVSHLLIYCFQSSYGVFIDKGDRIRLDLIAKMEQFDKIFSMFEFEYVKAMLPIKSVEDIERQQDLTVLFSETVQSALKRGLISQDEFDECEPTVIINIPRLAIIHGLVRCSESPIFKRNKEDLSAVFKPFYSRLRRIYVLLQALRPIEIELLEKLLINKDCEWNPSNNWTKEETLTEDNPSGRRYSDPGVKSVCNVPKKNEDNSLVGKRSLSTLSLMHLINSEKCIEGCDSLSISSNATTITNSTIDSFEIALALGAKHSNYVSAGSKQLLHNLFVSIAGIADQLQSNYASELRTILQNVYSLHCSSTEDCEDSDSVEEVLEAREESSRSFDGDYIDIYEGGRSEQSAENVTGAPLMPPIWVPDELVSVCTACSVQFTIIRRRHHCRNCGRIYCNNCCNHFIPLMHYGFDKPVRVCNVCFQQQITALY